MKLLARGNSVNLKLEDKNTGNLYANCPVDTYPGLITSFLFEKKNISPSPFSLLTVSANSRVSHALQMQEEEEEEKIVHIH